MFGNKFFKPINDNDISSIYPWTIIEAETTAKLGEATVPVPDRKQLFRSDGKWLADMGSDYEVVQASEAAAQFNPWIETGQVELTSGAVWDNGRKMLAIAKLLPVTEHNARVAGSDRVDPYLLFGTSFDGSLKYFVQSIGKQPHCTNAIPFDFFARINRMQAAVEYSFKHTKNIRLRIEAAQKQISAIIKLYSIANVGFQQLAGKEVTRKNQEEYIARVFTPNNHDPKEEISSRLETKITHVIDLLDTNKTVQAVPVLRGTAWQAVSAVTEYLTHDAGCRTDDSRLNSNLNGSARKLSNRAMELAFAMPTGNTTWN